MALAYKRGLLRSKQGCGVAEMGDLKVTAVAIIEDDYLASMALAQLLEGEGFVTRTFANAADAYASCIQDVPDILIADWCVPGEISTLDLAKALQELRPSIKVMFVSGYDSAELRSLAQALRGAECLSKPIEFDKFLSDIRGCSPEASA